MADGARGGSVIQWKRVLSGGTLCVSGVLLCAVFLSACTTTGSHSSGSRTSNGNGQLLATLNEYEARANEARDSFWEGEYKKASEIFGALLEPVHPSTALYQNEMAMCLLAMGDSAGAERCLSEAAMLTETFLDPSLERKALSVFGKESEKVYRGDPYERAFSLLLLGALFMDKGDYDNALAAFKSGLLADSDATENLYESDIALLSFLEAKCYELRGDPEGGRHCIDAALRAYRQSHPSVRDVVSERMEYVELLKMPMNERRKAGSRASDQELKGLLREVERKLKANAASVDARAEAGTLVKNDYNVLVLVPRGRSPRKTMKGQDGTLVAFDVADVECPLPQIEIDGHGLSSEFVQNAADVTFQACTRGGRRMDAILKGKAVYRSTTRGTANTIGQVGAQLGGAAGLAGGVLSMIVGGIAGSMTPEADTRCWRCLPGAFDVYVAKLRQGEHTLKARRFCYFECMDEWEKTFSIEGPNDMAVIVTPPSFEGFYSEHLMVAAAPDVLRGGDGVRNPPRFSVPPVLRLKRIERFPAPPGRRAPVPFVADANRGAKRVADVLNARGLRAGVVSHAAALDREAQPEGRPYAVQVRLLDVASAGDRKLTEYSAVFRLSLVDVRNGRTLLERQLQGICQIGSKERGVGGTEAFYRCLESAVRDFVKAADFVRLVSRKETPRA